MNLVLPPAPLEVVLARAVSRRLRARERLGAVAFQPESYLVLAVVYEGGTELATEGAPDVDAVAWPFAEPPDAFGEAVSNGQCDVASAEAIDRFAGELAAAGMEQFERPADGPMITLPWAAGDASVEVIIHPQRPDGEPPCGGSIVGDG